MSRPAQFRQVLRDTVADDDRAGARHRLHVRVLLPERPRACWVDVPDGRRLGIAGTGRLDGRTLRRRPGRRIEGETHP